MTESYRPLTRPRSVRALKAYLPGADGPLLAAKTCLYTDDAGR